jgi:NADH-quinone oxidoreductase subunit A
MPQKYVSILLSAAVIAILIPAALLASRIVCAQNSDPPKLGPKPVYAGGKRTAPLYIFVMMFVVFAAEAILLFPWAVQFKPLGRFGQFEMLVSLAILVVGYIWIWKKGALKWV